MIERTFRIEDLKTYFYTGNKVAKAVDGINFGIYRGKTLGIVGESGSGKSVTALSIMRLIPDPPGKIVNGRIWYNDRDLLKLPEREMRKLRGKSMSMIFQEPMTSLNPVFTIGNQIQEAIDLHTKGLSRKDIINKSIEMLKQVGIPSPEKRIKEYPHQMSGGMRQRVMIAMALSCNPDLLIADEPTTALDVTIQAQILDLLEKLKEEMQMSILLITHDMGIIATTAFQVNVMYAGKIAEKTEVQNIFNNPLHPYTQGLEKSIPKLRLGGDKPRRLNAIPGVVPSLYELPQGCSYQDRCPYVMPKCRVEDPELYQVGPRHWVRCFLYEKDHAHISTNE